MAGAAPAHLHDDAPASLGPDIADQPRRLPADTQIEDRAGSAGDGPGNDQSVSGEVPPATAAAAPASRPDSADDSLLAAEVFDEAGYLRLNPDVRREVEMGQIASGYAHYFWHGRSEGRALPDSPREARNTMLLSQNDSGPLDVFPREARCSLEALIIAPKAGLMIVGWIDDASHPLSCVRIIGPDWRVVIDASHLVRVRRADVEKAIGSRFAPYTTTTRYGPLALDAA